MPNRHHITLSDTSRAFASSHREMMMDGQEHRKSYWFARVDATTLTLAPAAGAGIGKMLAELLLADPDFLPALKDAAMGGLKAMRTYYDKAAGGCVTEPDYRTQLNALALLLAHMEGEPIKRIIHQHLGGEGDGIDPLAALRDSPALLAAVKREVEKAEWKHSGKGEHKRPRKVTPVQESTDIEPPS